MAAPGAQYGSPEELIGVLTSMAEAILQQSSADVARHLLASVCRATASDWARVALYEPGTDILVVEASGPEGASRSPHEVSVPIAIRGRRAGVLELSRASGPYLPQGAELHRVLGEHLGIYLLGSSRAEEARRLYIEAQRRLDETGLLLDLGRAVTATLDLEVRLQRSSEILGRLIDATNTFILLLDETGQFLRGAAASNPAEVDFIRTVSIPTNAPSVAARAVRDKSVVFVEDAERSNEVRRDLVRRFGEKSVLAIPLLVGGQAIGVVVIDETRYKRSFSQLEVERVELVAHQVAAAVANARLFSELKRSYSELARTQEQLLKRERLAALGQIAATVAHEVRNPLAVLFNSIGGLRKIVRGNEEGLGLLHIMQEESQRLNQLVQDLLDFARPMAASFRQESLAEAVHLAVEAAAREVGVELTTVVVQKEAEVVVPIDAPMVRRALINLVVNALQAAGDDGEVFVSIGEELRAGARQARIDVTDTGPGIPDDVASRIFEPFFTTKATGTGLGLAVVKGIVEAHQGEIETTSSAGRGTRFTIRLPFDRSEPASRPLQSLVVSSEPSARVDGYGDTRKQSR